MVKRLIEQITKLDACEGRWEVVSDFHEPEAEAKENEGGREVVHARVEPIAECEGGERGREVVDWFVE